MASLSISSNSILTEPSFSVARTSRAHPSRSHFSTVQVRCALKPQVSILSSKFISSPGSTHFLGSEKNSYEKLNFGFSSRDLNFQCQAGNNNPDTVEASQRVIAAITYFLPLLDGIRFGRFLFQQYPVTRTILIPLQPILEIYSGVPFISFIVFFGIYLGVIQNQSFSRYVRFNAMQAVVLDILMILPSLVERIFSPSGGIGREFIILLYNTTFIFLFVCFLFGVVSCLLGKTPRLPIVADAADAQVPF